jgi:hypothetical protein
VSERLTLAMMKRKLTSTLDGVFASLVKLAEEGK